MALTLADIAPVLTTIFADQVRAKFETDNLLMMLLPSSAGGDGVSSVGREVAWPIKFSGRTPVGPSDGTYNAALPTSHNRQVARLPISRYYEYAAVDGLAEAIAALPAYQNTRSSGLEPGRQLLDEEIMDAIQALGSGITADIYVGNHNPDTGAGGLAGVVTAATLGDGPEAGTGVDTFASIDSSSLDVPTEWQSVTDTHATASLDLAALRTKLLTPLRKRNKDRLPSFMTCSIETFDIISGLFDSTATNEFRRSDFLRGVGRQDTINVGLTGINVMGVPLLSDRHCPDSQIHAWYRDKTSIVFVPPVPRRVGDLSGFARIASMVLGEDVGNDSELREMLATARSTFIPGLDVVQGLNDGEQVRIKAYPQLKHNREGHGILTLT